MMFCYKFPRFSIGGALNCENHSCEERVATKKISILFRKLYSSERERARASSSHNVTNHNAYFYISSSPSSRFHLLTHFSPLSLSNTSITFWVRGKKRGARNFFACCLGLRRLIFSTLAPDL